MTMGTEPTPIRITPRFSLTGEQNLHRVQDQMLKQGASTETLLEFARVADETRQAGVLGQIEPFGKAAEAVGVEVHWVN